MTHPEHHTRRQAVGAIAAMVGAGFLPSAVASAHASSAIDHANDVVIKQLFAKELAGHPGEQVSMTLVTYPPGMESQPHKHHGPVFVYVIEGAMELAVMGGPVTTVAAGGTFYEAPGDTHVVSRNASTTQPAKLIAFIVGKIGTPVTGPPTA